VESRIAGLYKASKPGKTLAQKATGIIENLASGEVRNHMDTVESYTKYGEKRIKNCRKYDLGCGYRLITLQRGETVFIPFLGSHDECQRWLAGNSGLKAFQTGKGKTVHIEDKKSPPANLADNESMDEDMDVDDDCLPQNLTDKELRSVFKGLVDAIKRGKEQFRSITHLSDGNTGGSYKVNLR
jgi:hypothetical protein